MRLFSQKTDWGTILSGFGRPFGIGFDQKGHLLITDMDCHVVIRIDKNFDQFELHNGLGNGWEGKFKVTPGCSNERPKCTPLGWNGPHAVTTDLLNQLYVTCYYQPMIVRLGEDNKRDLLITGDELIGPATTRRDAKGCLLVSDYAQNAVLKYKTDGEIIWRLGAESRQVETKSRANTSGVQKTSLLARFDRPHMATPLKDETIVVADTWNNRLQRFSPDGELISWHSGDGGWQAAMESPVEASLGTFKCPVAVDENLAGDLLVTLWGSGNLMLLSSDGTSQPIPVLQSLNKPYDARFFGAGVVVADTGNGRVLVLNKV